MKVGASVGGSLLNEDRFEMLAKGKMDCLEMSLSYEHATILDYKKIVGFAKKYGIELWSCHLPFYPEGKVNPASLDKSVRDNTIKYQSELIKEIASLGFNKFIMHSSCEPIPDETRQEQIKCAQDSLAKLAEIADREGAIICVEDLPRSCLGHNSDEILQIISADDRLRVVFDTNHLLFDNNLNFVEKVGNKIMTLHVSDYDFINERHLLPGEGKIEWQPLYKKLCEVGYSGPWLYELSLLNTRYVDRDRELTYGDLYENAQTIFAGKQPAVLDFSHPKKIKGMWE